MPMSLWDIKVETKRQKCRKSRNERNKKQTLLKLTTFHTWRILVVKDDVYLKTTVMRRNRNKSYFIQPNLLNLHWKGFGWIRCKPGFRWRDDFQLLLPGFVVMRCFVLTRQLGAVDSEMRFSAEPLLLPPFWQTITKPETWRSTSTERESSNRFLTRTHSHAARIPFKCQLTFVLHNGGSSWAS